MKRMLLILAILAMLVLHQDGWNWNRIDPLLFGFLPVGLWYHAVYTLAAAGLMGLLVKFAWPGHLEAQAEPGKPEDSEGQKR